MGNPDKLSCRADDCQERLYKCKAYCRRCRVCPTHLIAQVVPVKGVASRFCQQCGRFHVVEDFDGLKRSCRIQLARSNMRRKLQRKAGAHRQQQTVFITTSHEYRPLHNTQKQPIDRSTEYDGLLSSGSSGTSQRSPNAGSAASEFESVLSRIIRLSGCTVSMICSSSPSKRQVQGVTADQQQMASKARVACDWQQQQQQSSSSDLDCCDDLQSEFEHLRGISLHKRCAGVIAVADADLHTLQSIREPSQALTDQ